MDQRRRELLTPGVLLPHPRVPEADLSRPSAARVYDYFLGGMHNFDVDRRLAERVLAVAPWVQDVTHANRRFLKRLVEYLVAEAGITQLLDVGSGIPTVGNVHQSARERFEDARVVYVDVDPVAVAYSRTLLDGDDHTLVVQADMRDAEVVLDQAEKLLDFSRPVAVLMVSVLLFLPDDQEPLELVRRYLDRLPGGSYLGISHVTDEHVTGALLAETQAVTALYAAAGTPIVARTYEQVADFFTGLELVEPGVVALDDWRNGTGVRVADPAIAALSLGGLARKPPADRRPPSRVGAV
ncbi:SAM-dependent methyltransferase [Phytohabitans sp. ZYX-F-186]|uniref:SAM-dependent methyltransferase n=1 Tax=Phytohabitans maris TaxID=3071409 RepID=A0ABU0ZC90_9ACTN|nr:SAM-dependent methyltransferase [Phytohabitans sp. ZYX-F-186]MDQ7904684.1 SAM-dependent methyltransferase [Phytohabitans sp. ZYX-F-186]